MRIFITGATGVLGKRVVSKLLSEGYQVTALCRSVSNFQNLERQGVRPVWGNIYDAGEMKAAVRGHDVVMHLASAVPVNNQKLSSTDWLTNDLLREKATDCLAEASVAAGVKLFLVPGVMLAYGDHKGKLIKDNTPLSTKLPADLQSAVKMEELVQTYIRKSGLPAVIMRLGIVYAEDSKHTQAMIDQLHSQEPAIIGKGDSYWNLIHADDAASAMVQAVKHYGLHIGEIYNICDGTPVTARDFMSYLASAVNAPAPKPMSSLSAWLRLGRDNLKVVQASYKAKNDKAVQKLKWKPAFADYRQGIDHIVEALNRKNSKKAA